MRKIITFAAFFIFTLGILSASTLDEDVIYFSEPTSSLELSENTMSIDVYINGADKIQLIGVPTQGYLEVYSILGVKVTNLNLEKCVGNCSLNLVKGVYILKAGKVSRKIIVK